MTEFELIIFTIKIQSKLKFYTIRKKQIQKRKGKINLMTIIIQGGLSSSTK